MLTSIPLCASGADFVFHTASPFFNDASDPQKELVDPAVNGTRNVMTSVAKNRHVGMRSHASQVKVIVRIDAAPRVLSCPCSAPPFVLSDPSASAQVPCTLGIKFASGNVRREHVGRS